MKKEEIIERVRVTAGHLRCQDNAATQQPIYLVQEKSREFGYDSCDLSCDFIWVNDDENECSEIATDEMADVLNDMDNNYMDVPDELAGWEKRYYKEHWKTVTSCFTRAAALRFIESNAHRMKETQIYVDSLYRNDEMIAVREFLMMIPPKNTFSSRLFSWLKFLKFFK